MTSTRQIIQTAYSLGLSIPAFNVAHIPMTEPIIRAIKDSDSFSLVEVSRVDWEKFGAKSIKAVSEEFAKHQDPSHARLHLDHVPVIDEDGKKVDYRAIIKEALGLGYQSVMIDGSRLPLDENIRVTREVADLVGNKEIPVEAELGAVLGHESGPLPPYEELYATGRGFTKVDEASRFAKESGCGWLSVAIGNIHGAVSDALKSQKKPTARLNLDHLQKLKEATGIPLVLHGGSGVDQSYVNRAGKHGIAKINVGTEIRQAYEAELQKSGSVIKAQDATYDRVTDLIKNYYCIDGIRNLVIPAAP